MAREGEEKFKMIKSGQFMGEAAGKRRKDRRLCLALGAELRRWAGPQRWAGPPGEWAAETRSAALKRGPFPVSP